MSQFIRLFKQVEEKGLDWRPPIVKLPKEKNRDILLSLVSDRGGIDANHNEDKNRKNCRKKSYYRAYSK